MVDKRRSRASFTRTLLAICARLDDKHEARTTTLWHDLAFNSHFTITSVWVAGSYARGALDCGDLDLVVEIALHSVPQPPTFEVKSALFPGVKGVSVHVGTPTANSSNVELSGAIQIWYGQGCDWQSAISSIALAPNAGHYPRPTDRIPFRAEQFRCNLDSLNELLEHKDRHLIRWTFTPIHAAVAITPLSSDELELAEAFQQGGKKTQELLPHLITYLRRADGWRKPFLRGAIGKATFRVGGAMVLVGNPSVPIYELDHITTSELLIIPHLLARGPNGVWHIERGDRHPLVTAVSQLHVYGLFGENGQPAFYCLADLGSDGDPPDSNTARGVDLFTSEATARDWAEQDVEDDEPAPIVRVLSAMELLCCLSSVDLVLIDMTDFALTRRGKAALGCADVATDQEMLTALAG